MVRSQDFDFDCDSEPSAATAAVATVSETEIVTVSASACDCAWCALATLIGCARDPYLGIADASTAMASATVSGYATSDDYAASVCGCASGWVNAVRGLLNVIVSATAVLCRAIMTAVVVVAV
jgi:hypothetical protein